MCQELRAKRIRLSNETIELMESRRELIKKTQ